MTAELHARAKAIFLTACDLAGEEQRLHVARACGGDARLRAAVEELLASDADPHALLAAADGGGAARWLALGLAGEAASDAPLPQRIGPYRVVRLLGRGGMGTVFEAEQESPRRRVAVKVLATGLASPAELTRFQREAQLLGRLHHPGIVHVYEAGTAEVHGSVQPYFALELVAGAPLIEHARAADLDLAARVDLLVQVCEAVQHAHEQGILHRDLKSSNIVVDAGGRPRVLDFGVARLLERDAAGEPALTASGVVVGTLATMSPEQVSGGAAGLDERSDVYSLGVVAYELLCGRAPLDVEGLSLPAAARRICEQDPPPAGVHDRALRGDLETILAKALAKERTQRYASAGELAQDLRRFARQEPIVARAPSTFYQLRMLARRNPALVSGLAVAAVALLLAAGVSVWFALRERGLRGAADQARAQAERESYRANVAGAGMALENGNPNSARRLLTAAAARGDTWEWRRVRRLLEPFEATFALGALTSRAVLLDGGRRVAAVGAAGELRVWDRASGRLVLELPASPRRAQSLCASDDGTRVVSLAGADLVLWDPRSGDELERRPAPPGTGADPRGLAAFSPDGRWLAVGGRLLDLRAVDAPPREIPRGEPTFDRALRRLAVRAAGRVRVLDLADGRVLLEEEFPRGSRALDFDPSGRWLAVGDLQRVHVFDLDTGARRTLSVQHPDQPAMLAFRPDGERLAVLQFDGSLCLEDWREDRVLRWAWDGTNSWQSSLAWTPDGEHLVSSSWSAGLVHVWDGRDEPEVLRGHASFVYPVAYTPDGARILSGSWDDTLRVWSADTGEPLAVLAGHADRVQVLACAPDGARAASGSADGSIVVWDLSTGARLARLEGEGTWTALAWSPAGDRIAAANDGEGGDVRILDAGDLRVLATLPGEGHTVLALDFAPGARALAAGCDGGRLRLWPSGAGEAQRSVLLPGPVRCVAFAPDGRTLAAGTETGALVLLDAQTLATRADLEGHARECFGVAFSPDGTRLASGGRDGLLRVWDVATGDPVGQFRGHEDYVWSVAFHPDGSRIVTGSGDGTLRQWESAPVAETIARRERGLQRARAAAAGVAAALAEPGDPAAVAARLRTDPALGPAERQAALDELLRQACGPR